MKCLNCAKEATGRSKYCTDSCKVAYNRSQKNPYNCSEIRQSKSGWLYLIQCEGFPYFKIGITTSSPSARMSSMQTGIPFELKLVAQIWVKDVVKAERKLHTKFANRWHRGEWFTFDALSLEEVVFEMKQAGGYHKEIVAGDINVLHDELLKHAKA